MPKVYDQEIKLRAMKLWIEGISGPKIVEQINNEFASDVKIPTLYAWAKQHDWNEQKNLARTEAMEQIKESEGQRFARVQSEHLTEYEGVRHKAGYETANAAEAAPVLNDQEISEVKAIAGGEKGYDELMSWASDNMSDADAANFDEVVETGNKAAVTFAVKALMGQYEDAVGRDSNLITGKKSTTETYRSMAEVVRDMNNPLYDNDESYRDDVRRKLEASNLKV